MITIAHGASYRVAGSSPLPMNEIVRRSADGAHSPLVRTEVVACSRR